jgi:RND family efflux transporter MFP subunit
MKLKTKWCEMKKLLWLFLLLISSSLILVACAESEGNDEKASEDEGSVVYVKTMKVKAEEFVEYIPLLGVAKANMQSNLSSSEGGRIEKFHKDKGYFVKEGDVIIEIDNEVLYANLEGIKALYEKAETNFLRQEKIYNENVSSEIQYLNSKYERDVAKANYELIKARYEQTFIKAPFSGIVDQKFAEVGENVLPGAPIVSLVKLKQVKNEVGVPENYISQIKKGDRVKVVFKDLESAEYDAKVTYTGNTISSTNRTFPIEIVLNNPENKIKPELSANVFIEKQKHDNAIQIPEEVVTKTDFGYVVFVENNNIAEMRKVKIVSRSGNLAAISSGLNDGDKLIVVGYQNLVDGEKVKVVD